MLNRDGNVTSTQFWDIRLPEDDRLINLLYSTLGYWRFAPALKGEEVRGPFEISLDLVKER